MLEVERQGGATGKSTVVLVATSVAKLENFTFSGRPCLIKQNGGQLRKKRLLLFALYMCIHVRVCALVRIYHIYLGILGH